MFVRDLLLASDFIRREKSSPHEKSGRRVEERTDPVEQMTGSKARGKRWTTLDNEPQVWPARLGDESGSAL